MVRDTSYAAYAQLISDGVISKKRGQVLLYIVSNPECTAWDCEEYYNPRNSSTINARFSELRDRGLIEEVGTKVQNGHRRITYRATGRLIPLPVKKKMGWKSKYSILLEACLEVLDSSGVNEWDKQVVRNALEEIGYTSKPVAPN